MKSVKNTGIATAMPTTKRMITIIAIAISLLTSCASTKNWGGPSICTFGATGTPPPIVYKEIKLTGTLVDRDGVAVANANVSFNNENIVSTDASGRFEIAKKIDVSKPYIITCSKEGYNNVSASYHYQMGNAYYNLAMGKPCICNVSIIDNTFCKCLIDKQFEFNGTISEIVKAELRAISDCMKNNPDCKIEMTYYFTEDKRNAPNKVEKLKGTLANMGINENRVSVYSQANTSNDAGLISITVIK